MNTDTRLKLLDELYTIHEQFRAPLTAACRKGCAVCCTDDVAITTLEGVLMVEALKRRPHLDWPMLLHDLSARGRLRSRATINELARQALADEDGEVDRGDDSPGGCPFLEEGSCPLYDARPLACRAMLSRTVCRPGGAAEMPEEVLALNTVIMQYVEAIDRPGLSGNFIDILLFLNDETNRRLYFSDQIATAPQGLSFNQPIPALMVPPEQRESLRPVIDRIQAAIRAASRNPRV